MFVRHSQACINYGRQCTTVCDIAYNYFPIVLILAHGQWVKRGEIISFFLSCITFIYLQLFSFIYFHLFVHPIVLLPFRLPPASHEISLFILVLTFLYHFRTFLSFSPFPSLLFIHHSSPCIPATVENTTFWGFPVSHQLILTTALWDFPEFVRKWLSIVCMNQLALCLKESNVSSLVLVIIAGVLIGR
jgi:hypothetical protein